MNKKSIVDQEIHLKALEVAGRYLKCGGEMLDILQTLDEWKTFRSYECTSLYQYAVKHLKLSEDSAFNLIAVARKAVEIPALKQELKSGSITMSKARRLCSVITPENQVKWLDFAKTVTSRVLEREVAKENPKAAVPDRASYLAWDRLKLECGVSDECMEKLRRVQDLESQRLRKPVDFEGTLTAALDLYLEKCDPVKKAKRVLAKKANALRPVTCRVKVEQSTKPRDRQTPTKPSDRRMQTKQRMPRSAGLEHQIKLRDEGRCTHQDSQNDRCQATRWLDAHHIKPVRDGGADTLENLTTLCRAHHQMEHLRT